MRLTTLILCILAASISIACFAGNTVSARGSVVDTGGNPVAGVRVYAVLTGYAEVGTDVLTAVKAGAVSRADGSFRFKSFPRPKSRLGYYLVAFEPDKYLGWARGEGDLRAEGWWMMGPEPADGYRIVVSKPGVREGRVTDRNGNGVPDATVSPRGLALKTADGSDQSVGMKYLSPVVKLNPAITDSDGRYRLTGIPEAAMVAPSASKRGYTEIRFGGWDSYTLVLQPGGSISGRLVDARGAPMPGEWINTFSGGYAEVKTGDYGSFIIDGVPPGTHDVGARLRNGFHKGITGVVVTEGKVTAIGDFKMPRLVTLAGRVLEARTGTPVAGARVEASSAKSPGEARDPWISISGRADSRGVYELAVLPGRASLGAWGGRPGLTSGPPRQVTVGRDGLSGVDLKLRSGDMARGIVLDTRGRPAEKVIVQIHTEGSSSIIQALTDANGEFELPVYQSPQNAGVG